MPLSPSESAVFSSARRYLICLWDRTVRSRTTHVLQGALHITPIDSRPQLIQSTHLAAMLLELLHCMCGMRSWSLPASPSWSPSSLSDGNSSCMEFMRHTHTLKAIPTKPHHLCLACFRDLAYIFNLWIKSWQRHAAHTQGILPSSQKRGSPPLLQLMARANSPDMKLNWFIFINSKLILGTASLFHSYDSSQPFFQGPRHGLPVCCFFSLPSQMLSDFPDSLSSFLLDLLPDAVSPAPILSRSENWGFHHTAFIATELSLIQFLPGFCSYYSRRS